MDRFWSCKNTWISSSNNTAWCLAGCAVGDFGTIILLQDSGLHFLLIFALAMINGILASIILEVIILMSKAITFKEAFKTALGMSLISMLAMELVMNITDYAMTGGAMFELDVAIIAIFLGFMAAWPYNYWRLKKFGKKCH